MKALAVFNPADEGLRLKALPAAGGNADEAAIAELRERLVATFCNGQTDGWAELFEADAVQMPPHAPMNEGRSSIRHWGRRLAGSLKMRLAFQPKDLEVSGGWAFENGNYQSTMTVVGTGEIVRDFGKYLTVYRRSENGGWAVARDIWNSDKPELAFV